MFVCVNECVCVCVCTRMFTFLRFCASLRSHVIFLSYLFAMIKGYQAIVGIDSPNS